MAIEEPIAQVIKILEAKKNILLACRQNPSLDCLAAGLALAKILEKKGKKADLALSGAAEADKQAYGWLPHFEKIRARPKKEAKIKVEFQLNAQEINGLTYKIEPGRLLVNIFPKNEAVRLNQPQVSHGVYYYDLVVTVGAPDLESLGPLYEENMELFYNTPIVNIDCRENNEHFGQLNLVDLGSVGVSETIFRIIESWHKELLDDKIATCLLAGIIAESRAFQNPQLTARTLAIASELVAAGAARQLVVEKLYGNKSVAALRLWGRALANLRTDPESELVWSQVGALDFAQTNTAPPALQAVIDDLLSHVPQAKCVFIVYQWQGSTRAFVYTNRPGVDLRRILSSLAARGASDFASADLAELSMEEATKLLKETIVNRWPAGLPRF